jgi:hypothetical protein
MDTGNGNNNVIHIDPPLVITVPRIIPNFSKVHAETIPDYKGDTDELTFFIESIDTITEHFYDNDDENNFQNKIIFRTVISKLKGTAREIINISGAKNIDEIKKELIRNFSDSRDETCLSFDLNNLRQNFNESPQNFYDKIRKTLNALANYLALHEINTDLRAYKMYMYNQQALKVFLAGLREPYGRLVRFKEPNTMLDAMNLIKKEENVRYFQNARPSNSSYEKPFASSQQYNNHRYQAPKQQTPMNAFQPQKKFSYNEENAAKPKNVWQPNPNFQREKSLQMSTSTAKSGSKPSNFSRNVQELYNTEQINVTGNPSDQTNCNDDAEDLVYEEPQSNVQDFHWEMDPDHMK